MKKNFWLKSALICSLFAAILLTACPDPNDPSGSSEGSITFTDGFPAGNWAVYVSPDAVSSFTSGSSAMSHYVAAGASTWVSGNKVYLIVTNATGGTFNKNGSYTVIFYNTSNPNELYYKGSVKFSGGSASLSRSGMTKTTM